MSQKRKYAECATSETGTIPKIQRFSKKNRNYIQIGQRGFLVTCNFREKECARDCLKILSQYADLLYGSCESDLNDSELSKYSSKDSMKQVWSKEDQHEHVDDDEVEDISTTLQTEIDSAIATTSNRKAQRFVQLETGVTNCIFIKTSFPDPVEIAERIIDDIHTTQKQLSRFVLRFIPIEVICKASMDSIITEAGKLFDRHFLNGPAVSFSIVFNRRYNNDIGRDDIYSELAELVKYKNIQHKVNLKNPDKTVIVEVIKGLCCMSVVPLYLQWRKYNLLELVMQNRKDSKESLKTIGKPENTETVDESDVGEKNVSGNDE